MKRLTGLLLCFIIAYTQVISTSALAQTQSNTSGSNTAITGGYTSSTTENYATGSSNTSNTTTTSNTSSYSGDTRVAATATAPSMSAYSQDLLTTNKVNILPLSGSTLNTPLFDTANQDALSSQIPSIKFGESNDGIYRGRMMNVLLNIDYVIELVRDFSLKDGTNSIYLKAFLEQIVLDINKYLGNFSILRLAYNDGGNTFHIVDDQVMPTLPEEIMLEPDNVSEIPLVGKYSIAKSLEIKTDVSTKLSNMIAISANSDIEGKSTLSTNGDSFGFINTSYKDRFIPIKGDVTGSVKSNQDTVKAAAIQFNQTISDFYSKINPSEANVSKRVVKCIRNLSFSLYPPSGPYMFVT